MTLNKIRYNPATSFFVSSWSRFEKFPYAQNMLLRIESTGRYTILKQAKVVYPALLHVHRKGMLTIAAGYKQLICQ
jgi:hypothetical protein